MPQDPFTEKVLQLYQSRSFEDQVFDLYKGAKEYEQSIPLESDQPTEGIFVGRDGNFKRRGPQKGAVAVPGLSRTKQIGGRPVTFPEFTGEKPVYQDKPLSKEELEQENKLVDWEGVRNRYLQGVLEESKQKQLEKPGAHSPITGAKEGATGYVGKKLPVVGSINFAAEMSVLKPHFDRIEQGAGTAKDYEMAGRYIAELEKEHGKQWWRKAADIAAEMPGFMVEFAMAGGITPIAKGGVKQAAKEIAKRSIPTALKMPQLTIENAWRQATPKPVHTQDGWSFEGGSDDWARNILRGQIDTYIETTSEMSGGVLNKLPGIKQINDFVGSQITKQIGDSNVRKAFLKTLEKGGYNGIISEYLEERVADVPRGLTEVGPEYTRLGAGFGTTGDLAAGLAGDTERGLQGLKQSGIELAAFSVFPAGSHAANALAQLPRSPSTRQWAKTVLGDESRFEEAPSRKQRYKQWQAAKASGETELKPLVDESQVETYLDKLSEVPASEQQELQQELAQEQEQFTPSEVPDTAPPKAGKKLEVPAEIEESGIKFKQTPKGWTATNLPEEYHGGLKTDYQGRRTKAGLFFRKDPTEGLVDAAREIKEENEQVAAAAASGLVRTSVGNVAPEKARLYEEERELRLKLAREPIQARNDAVETVLSMLSAPRGGGKLKGREKLKKQFAKAEDADEIPGFDEILEYSVNHPELGLPQHEGDLFELLKHEPWVEELDQQTIDEIDIELERELEELVTQQGLFGEIESKPKPAEFETAEEQQESLFSKSGLPGQQNLFADKAVPDEMVSEAAQRKADEQRAEADAFGFFGGGQISQERIRDDQVPDAARAPSEDVETRLQQARGLRKPSLMSRITDTLRMAKNTTRAEEHLPNNKRFSSAREFFRLFKAVPKAAKDEAIRTVAAVSDPLGPNQLLLFERAAIVENQLAALQMGQPLRFGFQSQQEVEQYRDQLQEAISKTPDVAQAIETRRAVVREKVEKLVEMDLLPASVLENVDTYFHQQVHFYMQVHRAGDAGSPGKTGRSFQRRRIEGESLDEHYDYNTSYLEAEVSWLADAETEIRKEELLRQLMKTYDIKPELIKQAKDKDVTWPELARMKEGYQIFQPEPGNAFYRAFSIPDRIVEEIQKEAMAEITAEDVRQVFAVGQPNRQFVVPTELVAQLEATKKESAPHGLTKLADEAMRMWKVWTLLFPKRILGYNLRNLTGDMDPIVSTNLEILNYTKQATKELHKYHGSFLALSPNLRRARDLGVVGSGFAAEEVPDISELHVFQRFFEVNGRPKGGIAKLPKKYFDVVKKYTEFRENILRYASYLSYLDEIKKGKVSHYGGANKAVVDQIHKEMGPHEAAAHLARNLIGDYGDISVAGNWIRRRLMPFWAFQEINLKRTPRLVINAWDAGGTGAASKVIGKAAARAILTSRIAWMFGALWVWNNLIQGGDEEDELSPFDRANPHIIAGRNADGSIVVFRNVGAIGDFLEWFGLNEALALLPKLKDDQITVDELASEMARSPIEKVFSSMRPEVSVATEGAMGLSLFPEPFSPRSVRRDEAIPGSFGLTDEYKLMKGKVLQDGSRPRNHYWQRWMFGVSDPRKNALSEMYDLRSRFVKSKRPNEKQGIYPVSKYKEAREAAQNEDYEAFEEWKTKFIKEHKDKSLDGFKRFLSSLDPIANKLSDEYEAEFEQEYLTTEQQAKLQVARQYSNELRDRLIAWWDVTETNSLKEEIASKLAYSVAQTAKPDAEQQAEIDKNIAKLKGMGFDEKKLSELLAEKLKKQGVGVKGRIRWKRSFMSRMK